LEIHHVALHACRRHAAPAQPRKTREKSKGTLRATVLHLFLVESLSRASMTTTAAGRDAGSRTKESPRHASMHSRWTDCTVRLRRGNTRSRDGNKILGYADRFAVVVYSGLKCAKSRRTSCRSRCLAIATIIVYTNYACPRFFFYITLYLTYNTHQTSEMKMEVCINDHQRCLLTAKACCRIIRVHIK